MRTYFVTMSDGRHAYYIQVGARTADEAMNKARGMNPHLTALHATRGIN